MHIKRFLGVCCIVVSAALGTVACDEPAEAPATPPTASPTPTKTTPRTAPPPIIAVTPTPPRKTEVPTPPVEPVVSVEPVVQAASSSPPTTPPPPLDRPSQLRAAQAELVKAQAAFEAVKEELLVSLRGSKEYQAAAKTAADLEAEVKRLRAANSQDIGSVSLKSLGAKGDLSKMEKAALGKAKADPKFIAAEREVAKWAAVMTELQRQFAQRDAALFAQRQAEEAAAALATGKFEAAETAPRKFESSGATPKTYEQPSRSSGSVRSSGGSVQCSGTTQKGNRCRRMTTSASGRCYQH